MVAKNPNLGKCIAMEDVGIFYGHLVHFTVFYYILLTFGIVRGNLVYFPPFWYSVLRKIWQPCLDFPNPLFPCGTRTRAKRSSKVKLSFPRPWNNGELSLCFLTIVFFFICLVVFSASKVAAKGCDQQFVQIPLFHFENFNFSYFCRFFPCPVFQIFTNNLFLSLLQTGLPDDIFSNPKSRFG
jgi:hypothetical protein